MVTIARECPRCEESGKNIKTLLTRKQIGKILESKEIIQEIAIDFTRPLLNAINAKKYLLVSIDHFSVSRCKILKKANHRESNTVFKKLHNRHGIPQIIRTDPATIFRGRRFKEFCQKRLIRQIECPVKDHRGNGKIERLIRTINETLRVNKQIVVRNDNSGLSEVLFALRMYLSTKGKSAYEKYTGKESNTIKKLVVNSFRNISYQPQSVIHFSDTDFVSGQDSTIMVRERTRGTKLEGA